MDWPQVALIMSLYISTLYLINTVNIVILCKRNKGRRLSWLRKVTNRRMILTKRAAIGMGNRILSSVARNLDKWEVLLVERNENPIMPNWRIFSKIK